MTRVVRADASEPGVIVAELADASAKARAMIARAERDAHAIREQAKAEARAELAAARVRDAQAQEEALRALEAQAIEIALAAAKRLLSAELSARPERVAELVAPHFARLRRARQITLRVHPDDHPALEAQLPELRAASGLAAAVRIESDPTLARGDCVLHSDAGSLDARIGTQLGVLARALGGR